MHFEGTNEKSGLGVVRCSSVVVVGRVVVSGDGIVGRRVGGLVGYVGGLVKAGVGGLVKTGDGGGRLVVVGGGGGLVATIQSASSCLLYTSRCV